MLEYWVVEDVGRASVVNQDPVRVVVSYPNANDERIVMWVVEISDIFFRESDNEVVDPHHLWDEARQLGVLNHPKVSFPSLFR